MPRHRKSAKTGGLFIDGPGQLGLVDKSAEQQALEKGKVECLGMGFDGEDERRSYFIEKLREKLADPEFRRTSGFPKGTDDDIIRMSDPPWYTACPNPFLADIVRVYGKPYDPKEHYEREPLAVDTSVGKTDALYKAHGYLTKVPHLAIVPSILHYTDPGDVVLDGFAGSGMTGVAALWCGVAPAEYQKRLEAQWSKDGLPKPKWGPRRTILNDLGPAATFIAANYNIPFDVSLFKEVCSKLLEDMKSELGWMYETKHSKGARRGIVNYIVWSEIFACPECSSDVDFISEAVDPDTRKTRDEFPCPHCGVQLTKDRLQRVFVTSIDQATGKPRNHIRLKPVLINYSVGKANFEKEPDEFDLEIMARVGELPLPSETPVIDFPFENMWEAPRLRSRGITATHHLFLPRQSQLLSFMWRRTEQIEDVRLRNEVLFFVEQAIWGMSLLARYAPTHYSQVNQYLVGKIKALN
jgi:predicted RNA-binding Zn-ribbon protein involved in translation (DUF1610 family)